MISTCDNPRHVVAAVVRSKRNAYRRPKAMSENCTNRRYSTDRQKRESVHIRLRDMRIRRQVRVKRYYIMHPQFWGTPQFRGTPIMGYPSGSTPHGGLKSGIVCFPDRRMVGIGRSYRGEYLANLMTSGLAAGLSATHRTAEDVTK